MAIKEKRIVSVDIIRIIAMLMVVAMHTIYNFTLRVDFFNTKLWFVIEPIIALSKTCVLLFFILSGYLVIKKNRSIKDNFLKTKKRILVPLLFFSIMNLIYSFIRFNFNGTNINVFLQSQIVRITNFPSSPLWFLVVLLYIYLLNPVWQLIFSKSNKADLALYLIKFAFIFSILSTLLKFPGQKEHILFNNFTGWIGYLSFYFYGGAIRNKWLNINKKWLNYGLIFFGFTLTIIGDYLTLYANTKNINFMWTNYTGNFLSFPVVMLSIGLFNLLITTKFEKLGNNTIKFITWLSGLSFGIYLIHTFVVGIFTDFLGFTFDNLSMNVYLYNILNFSLVLFISILIIQIIKITPKLKSVIGE